MSERDDVLRKALDLPREDREELLHELQRSFEVEHMADEDCDPKTIEEAWDREIVRRLEEYDSGRVKGVDGWEVVRQMEARTQEAIRQLEKRTQPSASSSSPKRSRS